MNRAAKGARVERRLGKFLLAPCLAKKHCCVGLRSAASRGPFDLVTACFSCGLLTVVNAKSNRWPSRDEMAYLRRAARGKGVLVVRVRAARWQDRAREPELRRVAP